MQGVAAQAVLEVAGAHCALLKEGGLEAALAEGGEGADGVVAQDDDGVAEVDLAGGGLDGVDYREGLSADLVAHVVRVGQVPTMTLPSRSAHQRRTMPQP